MARELNFKFKMPDDETLAKYISIKGEKGDRGDPTKLSQLENDTGFITANTDALTNYYTKAQTDSAIDADVTALETELGVPEGFFTDTSETVAGEGKTITLNGTANAAFKEIKLYGDTEQDGTPTPENPVEVQVVTGDQTIIISGGVQQGQSYTLSLGDIELCKIGNYQDYIWKDGDGWKLHKEVGKIVLDGSIAAWGYYASGDNTVFMLNKSDASYGSATSNPILASRFKTKFATENGCIFLSGASRRLNVCTNLANNPVDWRTWLASNPTIVYYALASATDEELTDQTLIDQLDALLSARTFEGQTQVATNGEISTGLYAEAYKNSWNGTIAGLNNELALAGVSLSKLPQKPYFFDNVAAMKAYNLSLGDMAITAGYYSANDGGSGIYKIIGSEAIADDGSIIALENELRAQLIVENGVVNVEQFGAYGDGTRNDTTAFVNAIAYANTLELNSNKTYKITSLNIAKDITINGNGATLIDDTAVDKFIAIDTTSTPKVLTVKFNDLNVDCPNSNYGIYIHTNRCEINNALVKNAINACVSVHKGSSIGRYGNLRAKGLACQLSEVGLYIDATDCLIEDYRGYNCMTHINVASGLTHINTAHGWNFNRDNVDWITGSVLINLAADVVMNDIYSDTLESTFVLPTGSQYMTIIGTNISQFLNTSSYPNTQASPLLVKNIENFTGWIKLTNISANANNWRDSNGKQPILFPNNTFSLEKVSFDNVISIGYANDEYIPTIVKGDVQTSEYTITTETSYLSPNTRKRWEFKRDKKMHWFFALKRSLPDDTCIFSAEFDTSSRFAGVSALTKKINASAQFLSSATDGLNYNLDAEFHNGKLAIYNHTGKTLDGGGVVFNLDIEDIT